jgi:hypothetical protein
MRQELDQRAVEQPVEADGAGELERRGLTECSADERGIRPSSWIEGKADQATPGSRMLTHVDEAGQIPSYAGHSSRPDL